MNGKPERNLVELRRGQEMPADAAGQKQSTTSSGARSYRRRGLDGAPEGEGFSLTLLNSVPTRIAALDETGNVVAVNEAWRRCACEGGDPFVSGAVVGNNFLWFCRRGLRDLAAEGQQAAAGIRAVLDGAQPLFTMEYRRPATRGERWCLLGAVPLQGGIGGVVLTHLDVTGARRVEEALQESECQYRSMADSLPQTVFEADESGRITFANQSAFEAFGYTCAELDEGLSVFQMLVPGDLKRARRNLLRVLRGEKLGGQEYQARRKDGSTFPVLVYSRPIVRLGKPAGLRGVIVDITERKRAEEAMRESGDRLRALVAASPLGIVVVDPGGKVRSWNAAAERIFGWSEQEVLGRRNPVVPIAQRAEARALRNRGLRGEVLTDVEARRQRKDGTMVDVSISAAPLHDATGHVVAVISLYADIGERKRAQEALRESEARFRRLAENAPDLVYRYEQREPRGFTFVNAAATRATGYSRNEFYDEGDLGRRLLHPDDLHLLRADLAGELAGEPLILRLRTKDGRTIWVEHRGVPVYDEAGDLVAVEGIARDVTERKRMEERLLRAQRLETAGRVAGEVAHDFNNLLAPLMGYPELIKSRLPEGHPAAALCDAMLESAERMVSINQDLLALGRRGHFEPKPTDLNRLAEQAIAHTGVVPEGLMVELDLARDLPPIEGDPAQLLRVVANLVANAREAMQEAGVLRVKTGRVLVDRPAGRCTPVPPGEYVRLEVSDTGCGIPPEHVDQIFDAFFTTKGGGSRHGCGLGLSVVAAIVADHRGYVDVETEPGKGSTFSVYLPLSRDALPEARLP